MLSRPLLPTLPAESRRTIGRLFGAMLAEEGERLSRLAANCTRTPLRHHFEDRQYTSEAIDVMLVPVDAPERTYFRPRGTVVLGLSSNEPMVVGVVPLLAAVLAGNRVLVRPASKNRAFSIEILKLLEEAGAERDQIELLPSDRQVLVSAIADADQVVWFGSSSVCAKVGKQALDSWTTFTLDAEGFDLAILDCGLRNDEIARYADWIIESIVRHDGQTCQAIRGVLAHRDVAPTVWQALERSISRLRVGDFLDLDSDCTALPRLTRVSSPEFPDAAPFAAQAWLTEFGDDDELRRVLAENPYGLSICAYSRRPLRELTTGPLSGARVARLLVNSPPHEADPRDPWGGYRRSGSSDPESWLRRFADRVVVRHNGDGA